MSRRKDTKRECRAEEGVNLDGSKSKDDKEDFMSWGKGACVTKPSDPKELKEVIINLLERRKEKELT